MDRLQSHLGFDVRPLLKNNFTFYREGGELSQAFDRRARGSFVGRVQEGSRARCSMRAER